MSKTRRRGDANDDPDLKEPKDSKDPIEPSRSALSWLLWILQPVMDVPCMCAMPFIFGCAFCAFVCSSVWTAMVTFVYRLPPPFPRLLRFIEAGMRLGRVLWYVCWGATFGCASWFTRLGIGVFILCMAVFAFFFVCCFGWAMWVTFFTAMHEFYDSSLTKQHGLFDVMRVLIEKSGPAPNITYFSS